LNKQSLWLKESAIEFAKLKTRLGAQTANAESKRDNASEEELTRKQDKIVNTKSKRHINALILVQNF
jgi:hypothetical protein